MSFFKSRSLSNVLIINIDSGSVSVAVVLMKAGSISQMLCYKRKAFYASEFAQEERLMLGVLKDILDDVFINTVAILRDKNLSKEIDHALIALSSPWAKSKISNHTEEQTETFVFEEELVSRIIREQKQKFLGELGNLEDVEIFETGIASLLLNGYETPSPLHKKTQKVEIVTMHSYATKKLLSKIESVVLGVYGINRGFSFQTLNFVFTKTLFRSSNVNSLLVANMSSEHTDMVLLSNRRVMGAYVIPFGHTHMAEAISKELHVPLSIAASLLNLFTHEALDDRMTAEVDKIVTSVDESWRKLWQALPAIDPPMVSLFTYPSEDRLGKTLISSVLPRSKVNVVGENPPLEIMKLLTEFSSSLL